jgi:hypothetical protein
MKGKANLILVLVLMCSVIESAAYHDPKLWFKQCKTITINLPPPGCLGTKMQRMGCYKISVSKPLRKKCNWYKKHP